MNQRSDAGSEPPGPQDGSDAGLAEQPKSKKAGQIDMGRQQPQQIVAAKAHLGLVESEQNR
jgi:hypothetical protein